MAVSSCPKCGNFDFEIEEALPSNSPYRVAFVQCSVCGAVVGVLENPNIGALIAEQNEAIRKIARQMGVPVNLTT